MKTWICLLWCSLCLLYGNAGEVHRVACIGNSITKGSWLSHPERDSYPAALERMLGKGWVVDNWGVSGSCASTESSQMYMKNSTYPKVKSSRPDIVTIFLGHDDARKPNQAGLPRFGDGLAQIVKDLKAGNSAVRIFLITPSKVFSDAYNNDDNAIRSQVIPAIKRIADAENVQFVDAYTATENDKSYFPDGIHPDANGAGHIAQALYKAITGMGIWRCG